MRSYMGEHADVVGDQGRTIPRSPFLGRVCSSIGGSNYRHFAGGGVEEDYEKHVVGFSPWSCIRSFSNNGKC